MEEGYYNPIETPYDALYEAMAALDNQDVPLELWPENLINALERGGYVIVPVASLDAVLSKAARSGAMWEQELRSMLGAFCSKEGNFNLKKGDENGNGKENL